MIAILLLAAIGGLMHAAREFALHTNATELAFGFLLLAAYFTAKLLSRFGLPKLTGYIISGVVTGPYVLGLVTPAMLGSLKSINGVAVCILGLVAGGELNWKRIQPVLPTLRAMVVYAIGGCIVVLTGTIYALRSWLPFLHAFDEQTALVLSLTMATVLTAQSPAVVIALIAETRTEGPLTQLLLAAVVVADLVIIVAYSISAAVTSSVLNGVVDVAATVAAVAWELGGSIMFGVAIGMAIGLYLRYVQRSTALFTVMVCLVVAELGSRIHLDPLICMIAAGVWLENVSRANAATLIHDVESAQLPVFLVFFSLAGAKLDIFGLAAVAVPVLVIALARVAAFWLGTKVACAQTNAPPVLRKYAWFGLVPQAGLALALALMLARTFPGVGQQAAIVVFGVVGVNEFIAPVILRLLLLRSGEAGQRQASDFGAH